MRIRLCLWLAVLALSLGGCGLFSKPTPTPEPASVTFVFPSAALTGHFQSLEAEFEGAHPSVDIVLRAASPYGYLTGGSRADVLMIDQLAIAEAAQANLIRPVDPLLQEDLTLDRDAFYQGTLDALSWRGQLWGLPADVDPWVLYFNRDLFDAAGVPYPTSSWTWDDLLQAAFMLTDFSGATPVYGLIGDMSRADFVPLVYQNGGALVDNLVAPTTATFTDLATVEAIQWYVDLALSHGVMPTPQELDALGGFENAVVGQRGAMWYGPITERGGTLSGRQWPFEWGVTVPPGNRERMTLLSMRAYVMSNRTEQPKASWEWIAFVANRPPSSLSVPPLKTALESAEFRGAYRTDVAEAALGALEIGHTMPPTTWIEQVGGWIWQAMQRVFAGELPLSEALAQVQESAAPLVERASGN